MLEMILMTIGIVAGCAISKIIQNRKSVYGTLCVTKNTEGDQECVLNLPHDIEYKDVRKLVLNVDYAESR